MSEIYLQHLVIHYPKDMQGFTGLEQMVEEPQDLVKQKFNGHCWKRVRGRRGDRNENPMTLHIITSSDGLIRRYRMNFSILLDIVKCDHDRNISLNKIEILQKIWHHGIRCTGLTMKVFCLLCSIKGSQKRGHRVILMQTSLYYSCRHWLSCKWPHFSILCKIH